MASKSIEKCDIYGLVPNVEEYQLTLTRIVPPGLLPEEPPIVIKTWKACFGYRALARAMDLFERGLTPPRSRKEKRSDDQTAESEVETIQEVAAEVEIDKGSAASPPSKGRATRPHPRRAACKREGDR